MYESDQIVPYLCNTYLSGVVVKAGDVGHKGKPVGGVGLYGVRAHGRGQSVEG